MSPESQLRTRHRVRPEQLRWTCDPGSLPFRTTAELKPDEVIIGQERAVRALDLGLAIEKPGYNVYIAGPVGTGRTTYATKKVQGIAATRQTPPDWCYLYNFSLPDQPMAVSLPPGQGGQFRKDTERLIEDLKDSIRKLFASEQFDSRRAQTLQSFETRINEIWQELEQTARSLGFLVQRTPAGIVQVPIGPSGEPISQDMFATMAEPQREDIQRRGRELQESVNETIRKVRALEREARDAVRELEQQAVRSTANDPVARMKEHYADTPKIVDWLDQLLADIVEHRDDFKETDEPMPPFPIPMFARRPDRLRRYEVNLVVDNGNLRGAPTLEEPNPTYYNLLGKIEYRGEFGALVTDFTMIKAGALQRANGGFLILQVKDLLLNPFTWEGLKRALKSGEARIENIGEQLSMVPTATLRPEPIPLNLKVILIGAPVIFQLLYTLDEDFRKLFKVKADFDIEVDRNNETMAGYASAVAAICTKHQLRPFDRGAVARILERAARLAERQDRLSTRFNEVVEIVFEADAWAQRAGRSTVTAADVVTAIQEKIYRSNRVEEKLRELIAGGQLLMDVAGTKPGQVNGLSVLALGDYAFGHPSRITARTFVGSRGVVNIERETELSGRVHSKGVAIMASYLGGKYAQDRPLTLNASLTFEQTYSEVDGDSASSTELYALVSELSGVPIDQGIAVTGSVNQKGEVQPIGGVNEKIEGYFQVCKVIGLTGSQGVMIPAQNLPNLMLREDVIEAVREDKFHIWAVRNIDEGLEVLTGMPAGTADGNGHYPDGSVNALASRRLADLGERLRRFMPGSRSTDARVEETRIEEKEK